MLSMLIHMKTINFTKSEPFFMAKLVRTLIKSLGGAHERLHITTLHRYLDLLNTIISRSQNLAKPGNLQAGYDWVDNILVAQRRVSLVSRPKDLTWTKDVSAIFNTLFSREHMVTFKCTRDVLYCTLFIKSSCGLLWKC